MYTGRLAWSDTTPPVQPDDEKRPQPPANPDGNGTMSPHLWAMIEACWKEEQAKRLNATDVVLMLRENSVLGHLY